MVVVDVVDGDEVLVVDTSCDRGELSPAIATMADSTIMIDEMLKMTRLVRRAREVMVRP